MTTAVRHDVRFRSGDDWCAGWLYPAHRSSDAASLGVTVVLAHGLSGVKEMRLDAYAERFAAAGADALVFDYRHFGASAGHPRQLLDVRRQHADWTSAVAFARGRAELAAQRLVLWGSSLSGGHVLALGARLHADGVIAQVPHVSGPRSAALNGPVQSARLAAHGLRDVGRSLLGRSPHYLPAAGAPGDVALMTDPEAAAYLGLVPDDLSFDDRVAARFALRIGTYSPGRAARRLTVPTLVQVGEHDRTTPPGPARRLARRGRDVRVSVHPVGHFDPYTGEAFEVFVAEQIAFLQEIAGHVTR
ncbi:lysophospholipase [Nocardioides sp. TRM66260-LWL]|uniref:alpha/beta hydrolase n=1 Tax=Nocardioides sp. TRM66260-LWL TaxID=2874478 RepID=UPI001CC6D6AD|nr:alpha/beta fold hydrolase [Nocardioides sp. TRM66260-LWL]MBZ5736034.1 lysophospholipase [Nocardioides sp. TRM66260-LWL]